MFCVGGIAPLWTAVNEMLVGLTVRPDAVDGSEPPPPPPPPPQAASNMAKATHIACALQRTRLITFPPFCLGDGRKASGDRPLFCSTRTGKRTPLKDNSTTAKGSQRVVLADPRSDAIMRQPICDRILAAEAI